MSKSIMQPNEECCYVTGSQINLDRHHVFPGIANRKLSEKYGLWVWLNHDVHMRLHDEDKVLELRLKQDAQRAFEKTHTRKEFMQIFGKSYL